MYEDNQEIHLNKPVQYENKSQDNMALASLIMGIIGIVSSCCGGCGAIFGILGIIFAILSRTEGRFEGYSKGGLITSIVALCLALMVIFFYVCMMLVGISEY